MTEPTSFEPIARLTKDLLAAAGSGGDDGGLSQDEVRFLVDAYYMMQAQRIRCLAQSRTLRENGEPHDVLRWLTEQSASLENQVGRALGRYAESDPIGEWCLAQIGIGPIIAAGLLAHIQIRPWKCALAGTLDEEGKRLKACRSGKPHGEHCKRGDILNTAGALWSFAGLDPSKTWEKGQKRPWNAALKTLCWKMGESFVKVSGNQGALYGRLYAERKRLEIERNARGEFKEQAAKALAAKKYRGDTVAKKAYESGTLPPAHLHARAKRYAVKIFLAHLHEVWYRHETGQAPPKPYAIAILGHADYIAPPALREDQ